MHVDESGDRLDLVTLLCMIDKVTLTGLILGVPFENVKLCGQSKRRFSSDAGGTVLEDCWLEGVDLGLEVEGLEGRRVGKSVVLRRQSLLESP